MFVNKFVSGGAPGIDADALNEPFHVKSATYDAGDDEIDVVIGKGRASFTAGTVIEKTNETTLNITSPAISTDYYIFLKSDGTFTWQASDATPLKGMALLGEVASGDPITSLTITDLRAILPVINPESVIPTGVSMPYFGASAPTGWVLLTGGTIGNASSGGTARAHADTEALFTLLYNSISDTYAPVSGGRGASAAADFAANKTITLPDMQDRHFRGKGAGTSLGETLDDATAKPDSFNIENDTVAAHNHGAGTLTTTSNGAHTHTVSNVVISNGDAVNGIDLDAGTQTNATTSSNGAHTHTINGSTASGGGDTHNHNTSGWDSETMVASISNNWIIKL